MDSEADRVVQALGSAISRGDQTLENIPNLLRRVIKEELWRDRVIARTGERVRFEHFLDFVTTPPLEGLGTTAEQIKRLVRDDQDAERELRKAIKHQGRADFRNNITEVERGTDRSYTLERLHRDHPELADQVAAGDLSPNAAAIKAGFRKPTATVPVDSAIAAIRALCRRFPVDELRAALEEVSR